MSQGQQCHGTRGLLEKTQADLESFANDQLLYKRDGNVAQTEVFIVDSEDVLLLVQEDKRHKESKPWSGAASCSPFYCCISDKRRKANACPR
jgi:hypothetical protein